MHYPFPSYRTLCQRVEVLQRAPGIQQQVMELLALKTKNMTKHERTCVSLLDEVQLREKVEYNAGLKRLVGYISPEFIFNGKSEETTDHALVYMLKELCTPYKQPIVWYFTG